MGDGHIFRAFHFETEEPQTDKSGEVADQEKSTYMDITRLRRPSPHRAVNTFILGYKTNQFML